MLDNILKSFGLNPTEYKVRFFGSGLIKPHHGGYRQWGSLYTAARSTPTCLNRRNKLRVTWPCCNRTSKKTTLIIFSSALYPLPQAKNLVRSDDGGYYRLFPFIKNSVTVNVISDKKEAYEAAKQFGKFTSLLNNFRCKHAGLYLG